MALFADDALPVVAPVLVSRGDGRLRLIGTKHDSLCCASTQAAGRACRSTLTVAPVVAILPLMKRTDGRSDHGPLIHNATRAIANGGSGYGLGVTFSRRSTFTFGTSPRNAPSQGDAGRESTRRNVDSILVEAH